MLSSSEAFQIAYPRRPAVLCLKRGDRTEMIAADWFTWLNMRHQPMISYAMKRSASLGLDVEEGDELYLAFPSPKEAEKYQSGLRAVPTQSDEDKGAHPVCAGNLPVMIPAGSDVVLKCTLSRAYNFPFKKVRIFNCDFEGAVKPAKKK